MLRVGETGRIPLKSKKVPILVFQGKEVREAQSEGEKWELLNSIKGDAIILAVWPGEWKSDTFILDKKMALEVLK